MRAMGEFVAASTLHEKLIEIRSLVQGPTHEETLHEVNLLSFALLRLSQHDRLETRLREHIARCEQSVGAKNLETFYARQNLALCLSAKGDLVGAEEEHRKTYSGLLAMNSPRSGAVLEAELNWCESLIALKRYNQARPLVEQAYEIATDIYGADFEVTRSARRLLDLLNGVDSERQ
jgi:tetratricopeptide (TPR) repeat protein